MDILIYALIAALIVFIFRKQITRFFTEPEDITKLYCSRDLLTDREYEFYRKLRPVALKKDLQIFTKLRMADLVEPSIDKDDTFWIVCFNKIKAKHIDFALADCDANIVLLIELDDSTHAQPDRQERDEFVDAVLKNSGYDIIHTYGKTDEIEKFLE